MRILYAFHQQRDTETIAEILAIIMCGMPGWSLKMIHSSKRPLNTLASKVKEGIRELEATGFDRCPEEDQMWVTGVPVTYTALEQFNTAYI